jgi:hypothetical protein
LKENESIKGLMCLDTNYQYLFYVRKILKVLDEVANDSDIMGMVEVEEEEDDEDEEDNDREDSEIKPLEIMDGENGE